METVTMDVARKRSAVRSAVSLVVALCCALVAGGCGGVVPGTALPESDPAAAARYGAAAAPHPAGLTYQPDVVIVGGGAAMVRSVSADGLVWTIDKRAPELDRAVVGSIMYLTSRGVGRVAARTDVGDAVAVVLGPIRLEDVFRDGEMKIDTVVDPSQLQIQTIPDQPGALAVPGAADPDVPTAPVLHRFAARPAADVLPPPRKGDASVTVGDWQVGLTMTASEVTASASYKPSADLKVGVQVALGYAQLHLATDLAFSAGNPVKLVKTVVDGLDHLAIKVQAGLGGGTDANKKIRIEIPSEAEAQVPGEPLRVQARVKLIIETALSGRNSTLTAEGRWGLNGPAGLVESVLNTPRFTVEKSIIDSLGGIAVGPSALVLAVETRFMIGIGVPGGMAGPYVKVKDAVGLAIGSVLGANLPQCRGANLDISAAVGLGAGFNEATLAKLASLAKSPPPFKAEIFTEVPIPIVHRDQIEPHIPLCVG